MNSLYQVLEAENLEYYDLHEKLVPHLAEIRWILEGKRYKELFVAIKERVIFGFGISWTNEFHPTEKYIRLYSLEPIAELLERLVENINPHNKIVLSCWEGEVERIELVEEYGFTLFRKTYMENFQINYLLAKLQHVQTQQVLKSLHEIISDPVLEEAFFTFLKNNYEQTHLHNEVQDYSWQQWKVQLLADQPDLELSYVLVQNENIEAYIMLHPGEAQHYEIGWVGQRKTNYLQGILKQQLLKLQARGIETVACEVDTTDDYAMQLFAFIEIEEYKSWNSYLLKKENE